jgi:hypothetical protein
MNTQTSYTYDTGECLSAGFLAFPGYNCYQSGPNKFYAQIVALMYCLDFQPSAFRDFYIRFSAFLTT